MEFNRETPTSDGRYLCIVENDLQPGWTLPVILTWRGQWLLPTSEKPHKWAVYGWIGVLPACKLSDFMGINFDGTTGEVGVEPSRDERFDEPHTSAMLEATAQDPAKIPMEYDL